MQITYDPVWNDDDAVEDPGYRLTHGAFSFLIVLDSQDQWLIWPPDNVPLTVSEADEYAIGLASAREYTDQLIAAGNDVTARPSTPTRGDVVVPPTPLFAVRLDGTRERLGAATVSVTRTAKNPSA